jgi:glycogen synthase
MSITSAQSYEMQITRKGDTIADPPQPYWQTVERLLADRGVDHVARLLAYALADLDKAQGKA